MTKQIDPSQVKVGQMLSVHHHVGGFKEFKVLESSRIDEKGDYSEKDDWIVLVHVPDWGDCYVVWYDNQWNFLEE